MRYGPAMGNLRGHSAVVTGASSGIGREMARLLAGRGADLVLVARREDRLEEVAEELRRDHGVAARPLACDLARPGGAAALWEALEAAPDILINNAGFGDYERFVEADWQRLEAMLQVGITSLVELSHRFCTAAVARDRRAYLLNVASLVAYDAFPNFAAYAAAKAFVRTFSESLAMELRGTQVSVTCLSPGGTRTEFSDVAGQDLNALAERSLMSAERCARIGVAAMLRGRRSVVAGFGNKLIALAARLLPRGVLGAANARIVGRPRPRALPEDVG